MSAALTRARARRVVADAAAAHRRHRRAAVLGLGAVRLGLVIVALAFWQLAAGVLLDPYFFSQPSRIGASLVALVGSGRFFAHVGLTVQEMVAGYCIGVVVATTAAMVLGAMPRAYAVVEPFILALYATPAVAMAPLIIVWFGLGVLPKVLLAAFFVFLVVFMNGVSGVRGVPRGMIDTVRVMGASRLQLYTKVVVRAALPHLFNGYRLGLPAALVGAMVGEFISGQRGIGYLIAEASSRYDAAGVFAALMILAAMVITLALVLNLASTVLGERR